MDYRVYRAVNPTYTYTTELAGKVFKFLIELDAHEQQPGTDMTYEYDIPGCH